MADELAIAAEQRVLRSADELRERWDGAAIDAPVLGLLENRRRDLEDALDVMPDSFNAGGGEA